MRLRITSCTSCAMIFRPRSHRSEQRGLRYQPRRAIRGGGLLLGFGCLGGASWAFTNRGIRLLSRHKRLRFGPSITATVAVAVAAAVAAAVAVTAINTARFAIRVPVTEAENRAPL